VFLPIIIVQWKLISGKKRKKNKASKMSTSIISVLSWPNKATRTHALRPKLNMQNPNPRAIKGTKKTPKLPNNFQKKRAHVASSRIQASKQEAGRHHKP
jgi:hypothetical protein